ncbi:MAG: glycerol-3-phosphate 1-O-acyltransferase PlsY [Alphaproteobacteria bacterium]|uniref:Glycerol-3-phosphate acyltransferase n=1 Tax=Candidatus Nitrobium versatile TaxID=2884831 RepID=A0A953M3B4_9BACT|nr:glycerol-3-phosphate 1-O-acyltransferase PlsY [Candidatus Nitrobium versatile]
MILLLIGIAFLIGSVPTGLLLAKGKGIDLKRVGSGNIGATNVMRTMGKEAALLTLIGDMAKGALPLLLFRGLLHAGFDIPAPGLLAAVFSDTRTATEGLLGLSAILGHIFSVFLKGKGGKGVATSLGMLLVLSPYVALLSVTIWLITAKWTRYSSLSALVAFGLLPFNFLVLDPAREKVATAVVITLLIFLKHIENIRRLIAGTESKIGQKG